MEDINGLYNKTLGPSQGTVDARSFIQKLKGVSTDHAADQKAFVHLLEDWKRTVDREIRGASVLFNLPPEKLSTFMCAALDLAIQHSGGLASWKQLLQLEKECRKNLSSK